MFENLTSGPLPSLNALRAFEAMARTGKATLAADCVTCMARAAWVRLPSL